MGMRACNKTAERQLRVWAYGRRRPKAIAQAGRRPKSASCSGFGLSRLVPRRWTYGDDLEGSALGPRSVVVHLIGDIVDDAARSNGNGVVLIELRPRADQESSGQDRDESLVGMRVRLAPIVGTPFGDLHVQAGF